MSVYVLIATIIMIHDDRRDTFTIEMCALLVEREKMVNVAFFFRLWWCENVEVGKTGDWMGRKTGYLPKPLCVIVILNNYFEPKKGSFFKWNGNLGKR